MKYHYSDHAIFKLTFCGWVSIIRSLTFDLENRYQIYWSLSFDSKVRFPNVKIKVRYRGTYFFIQKLGTLLAGT